MSVETFVAWAQPGRTLCLLNGKYGRLRIPPEVRGTASQPITIRALNEGRVLFDGGTGRPMHLAGSYVIVEGVNVAGGDNTSVGIYGYRNTVRRVVIWNDDSATIDNMLDMGGADGAQNVIEDCAVFGKARKLVTVGASSKAATGNVVRRCWVRWESRPEGGSPSETYEMGYAGQNQVIFENILGTIGVVSGAYRGSMEPPFLISNTQGSHLLGSIAYAAPGQDNSGQQMLALYAGEDDWHGGTDNVRLKDVVAYIAPGSNGGARPWKLADPLLPGRRVTLENMVGVAPSSTPCPTSGGYTCTNVRQGTSLAAAIGSGKSVWNEVPGICRRYVNGQLTNQPLWPWPMNQRIKDALVQSGRAPVDITQTMEELLGPIPQACMTGAPSPAATLTPRNLRVIGTK